MEMVVRISPVHVVLSRAKQPEKPSSYIVFCNVSTKHFLGIFSFYDCPPEKLLLFLWGHLSVV